jgi:hypothetical protein
MDRMRLLLPRLRFLWIWILGVDISRGCAAAATWRSPLDGMQQVRPVPLRRRTAAAPSLRQGPVVGNITKLRLINADTNQAIATYSYPLSVNGNVVVVASIDLDTLPTLHLNLEAITVGTVRSVVWFADGAVVRVEQTPLWSFCGNNGLDFYTCASLKNGYNSTIQAVPYSGKNATGIAGQVVSIDLALFRNAVNPSVTMNLTLMNADTGSEIGTLLNTTIIDIAQTPNINVRANVEPSVLIASVHFALDGQLWRVEHQAPYAFNGNYGTTSKASWTPPLGRHTMTASAFGAKNAQTGRSTLQSTVSISFVVVKLDAATPTPTRQPLSPPTVHVAPVARNLVPTAPTNAVQPPEARIPPPPPPPVVLFPTEVPSEEPTMVVLPPTHRQQQAGEQPCPVSSSCEPGMNLMHRLCVTACVPNDRVDRKRRAGWVCGRC